MPNLEAGTARESNLDVIQRLLKEAISKVEERIVNLICSTLQFTNFYFLFQSVIFTSVVSSSTSIKCKLKWIPWVLSLLVSIFTFVAIFENVRTLLTYYKELDLAREQMDRARNSSHESGGGESEQAPQQRCWLAKVKPRYIKYHGALLLLLVFMGVMLYGCLQIECPTDAGAFRDNIGSTKVLLITWLPILQQSHILKGAHIQWIKQVLDIYT